MEIVWNQEDQPKCEVWTRTYAGVGPNSSGQRPAMPIGVPIGSGPEVGWSSRAAETRAVDQSHRTPQSSRSSPGSDSGLVSLHKSSLESLHR